MKKALSLFLAGLMVVSLAACGNNAESQPATDENKAVADQSDMAAPQEIEEGTPVYGDVLNDGTYDITVESSSSMFNIEACQLTVDDGKMTAAMTMGGTGYLYVFPGTGEEAAAVAEAKARGVEGEPGHKGESEGKHGRENLASRVGRGLFHPERAAFEALQGVDGKPAHGPCARHHPRQGHHLGPELLCEVDGSHLSARHHPGGRDLEPLVVALPSLGRSEHLSPLTWCPENNTLSTTRP